MFNLETIIVSIAGAILALFWGRAEIHKRRAEKSAKELSEALDDKIRAEAREQAQRNAINAMEDAQRQPLPEPDLENRSDFENKQW